MIMLSIIAPVLNAYMIHGLNVWSYDVESSWFCVKIKFYDKSKAYPFSSLSFIYISESALSQKRNAIFLQKAHACSLFSRFFMPIRTKGGDHVKRKVQVVWIRASFRPTHFRPTTLSFLFKMSSNESRSSSGNAATNFTDEQINSLRQVSSLVKNSHQTHVARNCLKKSKLSTRNHHPLGVSPLRRDWWRRNREPVPGRPPQGARAQPQGRRDGRLQSQKIRKFYSLCSSFPSWVVSTKPVHFRRKKWWPSTFRNFSSSSTREGRNRSPIG